MEHLICNDQLRTLIAGNLKKFSHRRHDPGGLRHAAVALTIVDALEPSGIPGIREHGRHRERATIILTKRAPKLNRHSGQWALPGGRVDQGESVNEAALRELEEEVGLTLTESDILGVLDDFTTRSGFVMTPVVIWGGPNRVLSANPGEVASIHRIPLEELLRRDAPELHEGPDEHPVLRMPIGYRGIYAPTGALLYQFREVALLGRDTRVAHYDQPGFAWK